MSQRDYGRPTVKIRINATGHGTITIDDGPPLPVQKLRLFAGVNQATVVRFDLIAVNIDAELPVDIIAEDEPVLPPPDPDIVGTLREDDR
jgi:hypothetical protein